MTLTADAPQSAEHDTLRLLRESAADYCERALPRGRVRALRGAEATFDRARWREMAELGWASILVPEARGGLGLGAEAMGAVCEELGRVVAPEPMIETGVAAAVLLGAARSGLADRLLEQTMAGEAVATAAVPPDGGSAVPAVQARREGAGFVLNGTSAFMPLGSEADDFLIPVALGGELAVFHVAAGSAGVDARTRDLTDGGREAALVLRDVSGTADTLLLQGREARDALDRAAALSCLAASAYLAGSTEALLDLTLDYLRTRQQFGRPIGSFQALQHRTVDLFIRKRIAQAVVQEALRDFDAAENAEGRARAASRAKYRASETSLLVARQAIQLHGAIGFTDESDVGLYMNRALVLAARYGNAQWHARRLQRFYRSYASGEAATVGAGPRTEPPGGDWNALSNAEFRAIVRSWFERNYPENLRNPPRRLRWDEIKDWYFKLSRQGWVAPAWPREHGGMGLSPEKLLIFIEEQERWGVARAPDQGILMVGPLLIQHGTPEQQARFLPKIISGEHIWCQGYSEPNSGSDLASLRTSAVREDDQFVVNGQKTWTTLAQDGTHMFCLARTNKEGKPQAGISFLLIDLSQPGVTIRPIRNIAGHEEFCEVFLDNVRVPVENLVGGLNQGWTIAKALLGFERIFIGSPKHSQYALQRLEEMAAASELGEDVGFMDRLTQLKIDVLDLETIYKYFADIVRRGERLGTDVSLLKIWATETFARLSELMVEAAGEQGGVTGKLDFGNARVDVLSQFYGARPTPIYGGTNEIQRNILAKEVLGLPTG